MLVQLTFVAPYVGAWIETLWCWLFERDSKVAPYVGAWIETYKAVLILAQVLSHPTWVRGLKLNTSEKNWGECVAPYVGAWIETHESKGELSDRVGRTLRGCVD